MVKFTSQRRRGNKKSSHIGGNVNQEQHIPERLQGYLKTEATQEKFVPPPLIRMKTPRPEPMAKAPVTMPEQAPAPAPAPALLPLPQQESKDTNKKSTVDHLMEQTTNAINPLLKPVVDHPITKSFGSLYNVIKESVAPSNSNGQQGGQRKNKFKKTYRKRAKTNKNKNKNTKTKASERKKRHTRKTKKIINKKN